MAKPPLSFLPETSDEARQANLAYQQALDRLTKTLDARKNQTFDPVMMAMAAGFLGPTQTGSFGEALGRAAGLVGKAQEAETQQDIETAKAKMELAQSGLGMQRLREQDRQVGQFLQGRMLNQPGSQGGQQGAPAGGGLSGIPVMEPNPDFPTLEQFIRMNRASGKSLGELQSDYQTKFGKDRYINMEGRGVIDQATGRLLPVPGGANVTRQIIGVPELGPVEMDSYTAAQLDQARRDGDPVKYYKIAEQVTGLNNLAPKLEKSEEGAAPSSAPVSSGPPPMTKSEAGGRRPTAPSSGIRSQADIQAEAAATKAAAETRAKSLEDQRTDIMKRGGSTATDSILVANMLRSFASMPDAKDMFGLASQGNMLPNIVGLLQAGIGLPGGSINIAGLEDFYRNAKLKPEQLERYRTALQQMRMMNIMMSEYAKGAVSNYEQGLFGEASINEKDLPGTILLKSEALRARAQFDKDIATLARNNPRLDVEKLKDLEGYRLAEERLNQRYRNLILKKPEFFKDPAFVDAAKQNKPEMINMDRLPSSTPRGRSSSLADQIRQRVERGDF